MSRLFLLLDAYTTDAAKLKALPELVRGHKLRFSDVLSVFASIKDDDHRIEAWRLMQESVSLKPDEVRALISCFEADELRCAFAISLSQHLDEDVMSRFRSDEGRLTMWKVLMKTIWEQDGESLAVLLTYFTTDTFKVFALESYLNHHGPVDDVMPVLALFPASLTAKVSKMLSEAKVVESSVSAAAAAPVAAVVTKTTPGRSISPIKPISPIEPIKPIRPISPIKALPVRPSSSHKIPWEGITAICVSVSQDDRGTLVNGKHIVLEDMEVGSSVILNGAKITRTGINSVEMIRCGEVKLDPRDFIRSF